MKVSRTTEDLKVKEQSVYEKIVNEHPLPLMTRVKKSEGQTRINFNAQSRVVQLLNQLAAKVVELKTHSETYRAALYLGAHLLYHKLIKTKDKDTSRMYASLLAMERLNADLLIINQYVENFEELKRYRDSGLISMGACLETIEEQIDQVDEKYKKELKLRASRIMGGEKLANVTEFRSVGRPGSKEQELVDGKSASEFFDRRE